MPEWGEREGDQDAALDNSLGRLLALSDGVFAIAMTLLVLNLRVPELPDHPTSTALRHALAQNLSDYWTYVISFYVAASYWMDHYRLMRSVTSTHPRLTGDTLRLLLVVAALPFPSSLLGRYGGTPFSLALYGAFNVVATTLVIRLRRDIRMLHLADRSTDPAGDARGTRSSWYSLAVFLLCIPAGYVLHGNGPWVLLLLAVPGRLHRAQWVRDRLRRDAPAR